MRGYFIHKQHEIIKICLQDAKMCHKGNIIANIYSVAVDFMYIYFGSSFWYQQKMNKLKGCGNVPEMPTKCGADKRQSGWIHQVQRFERTICIPPVYCRNGTIINTICQGDTCSFYQS
jgi:hypothetical protein